MRSLAYIFLLFLFTSPLSAVSASLDTSDPEKFADNVANKIIDIIESDSSDSNKQKQLIGLFENYVDTDWMGKFVLGKYFRQLSPSQQKEYLRLYKDYVVYTYIPRFKEYSGERMKVLSSIKQGGGEYIIKSSLKTTKAATDILVDYRIKKSGNSFKIIDVIGEGVSLITTQRSDFAAPISQKGIDFFLDRLGKKVDMLKSR